MTKRPVERMNASKRSTAGECQPPHSEEAEHHPRHDPAGGTRRHSDWKFSVSAQFVRNRSITPEARFLHVLIKSFEGRNGDKPFPGLSLLADLMKRNRCTVQEYMCELEDAGFLVRERIRSSDGKYGRNRYLLSDKPKKEQQMENPAMVSPATENPKLVGRESGRLSSKISHSQEVPLSTSTTTNTVSLCSEEEAVAYGGAHHPPWPEEMVRHWYAHRTSQRWQKTSGFPITAGNWRSDLDCWCLNGLRNERNRHRASADQRRRAERDREYPEQGRLRRVGADYPETEQ